MARKTYTPEFKVKIVLDVLKEERTIEEIASEHDLNPNMVRSWRKEFLSNASNVFQPSRKAEREAMRNRVVTLEREGKYWSDDDIKRLRVMFNGGTGITEIAVRLGRSETAIIQETEKLGLFERK